MYYPSIIPQSELFVPEEYMEKYRGKFLPEKEYKGADGGAPRYHISAFWDFLPTITEIIKVITPENIDGISFLPTLLGEEEQNQHEYLYWEFHEKKGRVAIRQDDWKIIRHNIFIQEITTTKFYNLATDPVEENNEVQENPEITSRLLNLLESARIDSEVFTFGKKK